MILSKHTITLSRAHKISDRLGQLAGSAKTAAVNLSSTVTLQGFTEPQIKRLQGSSAEAIKSLELYTDLIGAQTVVRTAVAVANATHGISTVLTQVEGNKKVMAALQAVIDANSSGTSGVQVSELNEYKSVGGAAGSSSSYMIAIVLEIEQVAKLTAQIKTLEQKNFALSDSLADLNGKTVTFELIDDIAELVGLAGLAKD